MSKPILIDTVEKLHEHFGQPPEEPTPPLDPEERKEWERWWAETLGYDTSPRELYVVRVPAAKPCHRSIDDDWES